MSPHNVHHLPPSVQSVIRALQAKPGMTSMDLREATGLPRRTIYAALQKLKEMGQLRERPSLRDTRQTHYWWIAPPQVPDEATTPAEA